MVDQRILVADDEEKTRLTVTQALQTLGYKVTSAVNGQKALEKLEENEFSLILLDLKIAGKNNLEILRRVIDIRPDIRVIIISASGTVEKVVEAIKLGAVDFIQKPFTPQELREIVTEVLDRAKIEAAQVADYESHLKLIKRCMNDRHFEAAMTHAKQAVGTDPSRPEAFNLMGVLYEITGNTVEAMKNYRVAIDLDPTYEPAWQNLNRPQKPSKGWQQINLG